MGSNVPVYIPENGFIGLNVALTGGRKGSCSTRTTHPFFLSQFKHILKMVGIQNPIENFFAFNTKREIVRMVKEAPAFQHNFGRTISCSHPCIARYNRTGTRKYPVNCGYCYPCIIRKSSLLDVTDSGEYTTDVNVKSRAHFSMAQIYDDVNQIEPAMNHYFTSISYAGKSDDLIGQSDSLTKMANILTDKYDDEAFEYYDTARKLIDQTTDASMKGYVLSNTADACVQFRKSDKALKYYAEAVKNYEKTNSKEEIAQNYKAAAELMISFNSPNKAKSLLKKALINSVKTTNDDLTAEINMLLASIE